MTDSSLKFYKDFVATLINMSYDQVLIFGESLPAEIFLSVEVRKALSAFSKRDPRNHVYIVTNEFTRSRTYVEQLSEYDDHVVDTKAIKLIPCSALAAELYPYIAVFTDTSPRRYALFTKSESGFWVAVEQSQAQSVKTAIELFILDYEYL